MPKPPFLAVTKEKQTDIYCHNDAKNAMHPIGKSHHSCGFAVVVVCAT